MCLQGIQWLQICVKRGIFGFKFVFKVAAVQVAPNQLAVTTFPSLETTDLKTDIHIKGVYCTQNFIAIWNRRKVAVYEVTDNKSLVRSAGL